MTTTAPRNNYRFLDLITALFVTVLLWLIACRELDVPVFLFPKPSGAES